MQNEPNDIPTKLRRLNLAKLRRYGFLKYKISLIMRHAWHGYPIDGLNRAMQEDVAFIGVDAGSTGLGPYYLGSGKAFVKVMQIRRDLDKDFILKNFEDGKISPCGPLPELSA